MEKPIAGIMFVQWLPPSLCIPLDDKIALVVAVVRLVSCLKLTRYQTTVGQVFTVYAEAEAEAAAVAVAADSRRYQRTPPLPLQETIPQLAAAAAAISFMLLLLSSSLSLFHLSIRRRRVASHS